MKSLIAAFTLITLFVTTTASGETKAGFMTTELTNFAGSMTITVWYPTSNKIKGPSEYDFEGTVLAAGAVRDAPIKGGTFPLIVTYPGGGGADTRFTYFPNAELLAADGYIVVIPGRNTQVAEEQGALLSDLISHMLYEHPLHDSIDASKIGAKGLSYGGIGVASIAGAIPGEPADNRVRAVIVDEGLRWDCDPEYNDCSLVEIPVMLRRGTLSGFPEPGLSLLENSFPRFLVTIENLNHFGFVTGFCPLEEEIRLISLDYQQALGGEIQDPRALDYLIQAIPVAYGGNGDEAGYFASFFWNYYELGGSCGLEYGGPPTPLFGILLDEKTVIETLHVTDLGFWETVFGDSNTDNTKLEKAVSKLDTIESIIKISE